MVGNDNTVLCTRWTFYQPNCPNVIHNSIEIETTIELNEAKNSILKAVIATDVCLINISTLFTDLYCHNYDLKPSGMRRINENIKCATLRTRIV